MKNKIKLFLCFFYLKRKKFVIGDDSVWWPFISNKVFFQCFFNNKGKVIYEIIDSNL